MSETDQDQDDVARIAARYAAFLDDRQKNAAPGDIRGRILALRSRPLAIGFAQRNLMSSFAAGLSRMFPKAVGLRGDPDQWRKAQVYLCSGAIHPASEHSHPGANRIFGDDSIPNDRIVLFEMGFLASAYSWSHGLRQGQPEAQCLGYVYDDIAHYYMADYPNRLIDRLNGPAELTAAEHARAEALMARIVARRISKYNAQPMLAPAMTPGYDRRVLVCDQSFADASTVFGRIDERGFQDMLIAAIAENPDAEIIVKTHPDTTWEAAKRTGYYTHLSDYENVRILRDPVNPFALFDHVDTVYAGTSQIGLEALFAGKKVVTFGAPFYAGWGLTDDRQTIPHRGRTRSLGDLFHAFYVWYTVYHVPGRPVPSTVEDALDYIEEHRPVTHLPPPAEPPARPKVSVILPVHDVEDYVEQAIRSALNQTLREIEVIPVNDASPDASQAIIDRLAAEDPRVRPLVLTENVGQGFARNAGLDAARGDYVWFLDADDWFADRGILAAATDRADATGADLVRTRKAFQRITGEDGKFLEDRPHEPETFFPDDIARTDFAACPALLRHVNVYTLLYRRSFLDREKLRFGQPRYEERAFLTAALLTADCISILDHPAIGYRVRDGSTMRRPKNRRDLDFFADQVETIAALYAQRRDRIRPGGDLEYHFRYTMTLLLHFVVRGWVYPALRALNDGTAERDLLGRVRAAFASVGFSPDRIEVFREFLDADWSAAGRYHLTLAAIAADRPDLLRCAVEGAPVPQRLLAEQWRADPQSALSQALNRYAGQGHVELARPAAAVDVSEVRLLLHIGSSKAGSTYLQHWLDGNRPALLAQGIYVPEVGLFRQPGRPHKTAGHAGFSTAAQRGDHALRNHVLAMLERAGGAIHTVLLSSEAFFLLADPGPVCDYFHGFRREMLVYLRPQDDWANSQYCEFVGGGAIRRTGAPPAEWLQMPEMQLCLDYAGKLDRWAETLGADRITVRPFESAQFAGGSLLNDFAAAAGIAGAADLPDIPDALRNDALLPAPYLTAMRAFNALPFAEPAAYLRFTQAVHDIAARHGDGAAGRPEMLGADLRAALRAAAVAGNDRVAARFLKRPDGLFRTPPPDLPTADPDTGSLPADAVAAMLAAYRATLPDRDPRGTGNGAVRGAEPGPAPRRRGLRGYARLARDFAALWRSPLFDAAAYAAANPDVAASRMPPHLHFLLYGGPELRNPGPGFDTRAYYRKNPDVRASGENALLHYIRHGQKEGRRL